MKYIFHIYFYNSLTISICSFKIKALKTILYVLCTFKSISITFKKKYSLYIKRNASHTLKSKKKEWQRVKHNQ